jgi:hypothetical protein
MKAVNARACDPFPGQQQKNELRGHRVSEPIIVREELIASSRATEPGVSQLKSETVTHLAKQGMPGPNCRLGWITYC